MIDITTRDEFERFKQACNTAAARGTLAENAPKTYAPGVAVGANLCFLESGKAALEPSVARIDAKPSASGDPKPRPETESREAETWMVCVKRLGTEARLVLGTAEGVVSSGLAVGKTVLATRTPDGARFGQDDFDVLVRGAMSAYSAEYPYDHPGAALQVEKALRVTWPVVDSGQKVISHTVGELPDIDVQRQRQCSVEPLSGKSDDALDKWSVWVADPLTKAVLDDLCRHADEGDKAPEDDGKVDAERFVVKVLYDKDGQAHVDGRWDKKARVCRLKVGEVQGPDLLLKDVDDDLYADSDGVLAHVWLASRDDLDRDKLDSLVCAADMSDECCDDDGAHMALMRWADGMLRAAGEEPRYSCEYDDNEDDEGSCDGADEDIYGDDADDDGEDEDEGDDEDEEESAPVRPRSSRVVDVVLDAPRVVDIVLDDGRSGRPGVGAAPPPRQQGNGWITW